MKHHILTKSEQRELRARKVRFAPHGGTRAGQRARTAAAKGYAGTVKKIAKLGK